MFVFGSPDQLSDTARQAAVAGLILVPLVGFAIKRALSLGLLSFLVLTVSVYTGAMLVVAHALSNRFHSLELTPDAVILTFPFPEERKDTIGLAEITDIRFGLGGGKGLHRCYLAVHTQERRLISQLSRDCDYVKKTARSLVSGASSRARAAAASRGQDPLF